LFVCLIINAGAKLVGVEFGKFIMPLREHFGWEQSFRWLSHITSIKGVKIPVKGIQFAFISRVSLIVSLRVSVPENLCIELSKEYREYNDGRTNTIEREMAFALVQRLEFPVMSRDLGLN
jgi:hypothetical protein